MRHKTVLSSFAENPEISNSGMNAQVASTINIVLKGFLLRRIPPAGGRKPRALARGASLLSIIFLAVTVFSIEPSYCQENRLTFPEGNTSRYKLDNGLTFIFKEDKRTPTFACVLLIKTGSASEGKYNGSGITHFIEHLIFKGTSTRNAQQIESQIKSYGADIGAYTTFDYTAFKIQGPSDNILPILDIFYDIIANPAFDEEEIAREKNVIINEMRLIQDDPEKYMSTQLWQSVYLEHPYRNPIIGYKEIFENLTRDNIVDYYNNSYVPDNMVLVIAGAMDTKAVNNKTIETFGKLKRRSFIIPALPEEPEQITSRYKELPYSVSKMHLTMGFHSVSLTDRDLYAMDTLAILLGVGRSCVLYQSLHNRLNLVHGISAYNYTPFHPGLFLISATLDPEKKDETIKQIWDEIGNFKKASLKNDDLDKAKNLVISDYLFSKQSQESEADDLGVSELLTGDMDFSKRYIEGINAVTSNDIISVANKYLTRENVTTFIMLSAATQSVEPEEPAKVDSSRKVSKETLRNGVRVLITQDKNLPLVSLRVCIKAGLRVEDKDDNGISNLTAEMLTKGTSSRNEEQLFTDVESLGGGLSAYSANNSFGISLDIMSKDFEKGLDIVSDVLLRSAFPKDELRILKENTLASIELMKDDIFTLTEKRLRESLFTGHPYSMLSVGNPDSIKKISRNDIIKFYNSYFVGPNVIISVCGDIEPEKARSLISSKFKGIKKKNPPSIKDIELARINEKVEVKASMDKKQAVVMIGFRSVGTDHPDRNPLQILSSMFSGGAGRLYAEIRQKKGLAYTLGTFGMIGVDTGSFIFYASTAPENTAQVKDEIIAQIRQVNEGAITEEEIESAKKSLISKHQIDLQTAGAFALKTALDELYGLGFDNYLHYPEEINKISREEIIQIANKYFTLENCVISITEPEEK